MLETVNFIGYSLKKGHCYICCLLRKTQHKYVHWHQFIQAEKSAVSIKSSSNGITFPLSLFTNVFNLI